MRTLFADFNSMDVDDELGRFVPLGTEDRNEELRGLVEGERVLLREPNELQAEGRVVSRVVRREKWWLGVLTGEIQMIYQESTQAAAGQ